MPSTSDLMDASDSGLHRSDRALSFVLGRKPALYVNEDRPFAVAVARAAVLIGLPLWLASAALERSRLASSDERYRGSESLYWNTVGPAAFVDASIERVFGRKLAQQEPTCCLDSTAGSPSVIVVDGFYPDPDSVRHQALEMTMRRFDRGWFKSDGAPFGSTSDHYSAFDLLQSALGVELDYDDFATSCSGEALGWHGAFHVKTRENWLSSNSCDIHNHSNLGPSWSGVVFLGSRPASASGTSFWRRRGSSSPHEPKWIYDGRIRRFERLALVTESYNRLVLFRNDLLHRGEAGYGTCLESGRLFQTFFFRQPVDLESLGYLPRKK